MLWYVWKVVGLFRSLSFVFFKLVGSFFLAPIYAACAGVNTAAPC